MSITTNKTVRALWASAATRLTGAKWRPQPPHHRIVHEFRLACEAEDTQRLRAVLDPAVAVVIDDQDAESPRIRMVRGALDAVPLLFHGLAYTGGGRAEEVAVNGQAGLMLTRNGEPTAAINIDVTGGLISVIWVGLHPVKLRHWNAV